MAQSPIRGLDTIHGVTTALAASRKEKSYIPGSSLTENVHSMGFYRRLAAATSIYSSSLAYRPHHRRTPAGQQVVFLPSLLRFLALFFLCFLFFCLTFCFDISVLFWACTILPIDSIRFYLVPPF